jgi:integration host factor subunit beta
MIKSVLVHRLAALNPHLYRDTVAKTLDAILEEIVSALAHHERVELRGFGAFFVKAFESRPARNPKTGDNVQIPKKVFPRLDHRPRWDDASTPLNHRTRLRSSNPRSML